MYWLAENYKDLVPVSVLAGQTPISLITLLSLCKHQELATVVTWGGEVQSTAASQDTESIIQMAKEDAEGRNDKLHGLLLLNCICLHA